MEKTKNYLEKHTTELAILGIAIGLFGIYKLYKM